MIYNKVGIACN